MPTGMPRRTKQTGLDGQLLAEVPRFSHVMPDTVPYPPRDEHEEFANTLTHAAGVVLSVVGGAALLSSCAHWTVAVACGLYALTLVATYAASALSHGVRRPDWKRLLSIWDQGVIFLLIIGTYTPFLVAYIPSAWTMPVLVILWGAALLGFASKVLAKHRIDHTFSPLPYVALGWLPAIILAPFVPLACLAWMAAGGVLYTVGVIFLVLDRRVRYFHAAWHLFVLGGSACHYIAILSFVVLPSGIA
jgi:hemolysin III